MIMTKIIIISLSFQSTTRVCKMACRSKSFGRSSSYSDEIYREKFSTCNLWFFEKCPGKMPARCCWVKDRKNKSFASWSFTDVSHAKKKRHPLFLLVGKTKQNSRFYPNFLRDFSSEFVTNLRYTIFPRYSSFAAVAARPLPQQFLFSGHSLFQSFKQ